MTVDFGALSFDKEQDAVGAYIWAWSYYGYDTWTCLIAAKELSSHLTREDKSFTPLVCWTTQLIQYVPLYIGMRIYINLKVYILPPLNLIFSQAMLNIVVYQMLIVTKIPVNSAAQCVTLSLIFVDTGLTKLYLPLLVTGIHCTMWWVWKHICQYQWSWHKPYSPGCNHLCPMLQFRSKHVCIEDVHIFKH